MKITLAHLSREIRFFCKRKSSLSLLAVAFLLSSFAIWSGLSEMQKQTKTIEELLHKDRVDRETVLAQQSDYGSAAYYSFHLTYLPPSELAFAAVGQRDVSPWKHRVRMLALEGQIYETDADNPELSFLGRLDFAFVVSVLLPLFVILSLYDQRSSEREAGRLELLVTTARKASSLWLTRSLVTCLALAIALLVPFFVGAFISGATGFDTLLIALLVIAHIAFWALLSAWLSGKTRTGHRHSVQNASILLSLWLALTVLVPATSDIVIDKVVASPTGGEILLVQREAVNDAWDLPDAKTWEDFLSTHPQWREHTDMGPNFEWKWYYAFQQVGDQKAAPLSLAYRNATVEKDKLASVLAWLSPPVLIQRQLSAIAATDVTAALAYESSIRAYHKALRQFYYPLMFNRRAYHLDTMAELPDYSDFITKQ